MILCSSMLFDDNIADGCIDWMILCVDCCYITNCILPNVIDYDIILIVVRYFSDTIDELLSAHI